MKRTGENLFFFALQVGSSEKKQNPCITITKTKSIVLVIDGLPTVHNTIDIVDKAGRGRKLRQDRMEFGFD
jgi:hypothetical protein